MAGPKVTAAQFVEKHSRRSKAALQDMRDGVQRVTEAPGIAAAAKADKMRANLVASLDNGKWQRRVAAVSLEEWKRAMIDKGVNRVAAGIDASEAKTRQFAEQLLSHQAGLMAKIEQMPDLTLEDGIARSTAMIRGMAEFEFSR